MKKQILTCLAVLVLLVMLPVTARADGVTEYAASYEEAIQYLAENKRLQSLYIQSEGFSWPSEEVTLDLTAASTSFNDVQIIGDWVIPENVTVLVNEWVTCFGSVTVNGTWVHNSGCISMYGRDDSRFTVNGKISLPSGLLDLLISNENQNVLYLNGELELNGTKFNVMKLVLGDGAKVTETNTSSLLRILDGGSITVPSGSALIDTQLETGDYHTVSTMEDCTITGNLHVAQLQATSLDRFVISEGSCVTTDYLVLNGAREDRMASLQVNGVLRLTNEKYHNMDRYATITIGRNGILVLDPSVSVSSQDSGISINGTGRIICSSIVRKYDNGRIIASREAELFESWQQENGWPSQVAESVTIVRYSENPELLCEEHTWINEEHHEPTCGTGSYTSAECSVCYVWSNHDFGDDATGEHTEPNRYRTSGTNTIEMRCSTCNYWGKVTLTAPEKVAYTGQPVTPAIIGGDAAEWVDCGVVYSNNTEAGIATASLTLGGYTVSVTFEIVVPITAETSGNTAAVEICLSDLPEMLQGESLNLIAALYENGRLVGTELKSVTVGEGNTVEESLEMTFGSACAPDRCKVFLLNPENSAPLVAAQEDNSLSAQD